MGTFQMAILLCFNERDQLKVKDIQEQTQLSLKELIKQIQSLIESKLVSTQNEEDISEISVIELNNEYSNKRTKFKITAAVQKDSPQVRSISETFYYKKFH
jgi:cullin 2